MSLYCEELNKSFTTKEEMFAAIKGNAENIISLKKSAIKQGIQTNLLFITTDAAEKGVIGDLEIDKDYIYPVISTTRFFDSHKDVHFDGCFTKTVGEQQGKVYYALDHSLKWGNVIAWPKDVSMEIKTLPWSAVGKTGAGTTEALVFKIHKTKVQKPDVLKAIEDKMAEFENSISMFYVKINLGIDSTLPEFKEEKLYFDSRINSIFNKEDVYQDGYFWGVEELKIHKEGSLVIGGGSNSATRILSAADEVTVESKQVDPQEQLTVAKSDYFFTI